ncbi:hypothetical protein D8674_042058 [Pyrus ussuriensis x Pyrus communis]|uniref:FLZ-type domain-containing protein n=1 Tax=Pyrus ussuriensis x Pyrus communis TaxID=2448454 RepID=A0A5N5H6V9_9ROSA|nr:hypothetical protein D8674_042058 [Pyrus ussuriensis x Pyrus communis]
MLKFGKRPLPMVGKISELLVSGSSARFSDRDTSPRGPLDLKIQPTSSPRGVKSYDVGGVGLGILAALEKSTHNGREILAKYAVLCPNTNRSDPIPVNSGQNCDGFSSGGVQEFEEDSSENYTYVTLRGQKKSCTKVYYDGGDCAGSAMHRRASSGGLTICADDLESSVFSTSDFLSCCHLCKKNLHGKDIYMYRGEKAFCSTECRSTEIVADERKEQCRLEALRSADVSSSSCSKDEIFSTGILVI